MQPIFAHVDCNNFYVSCERVFAPKLKGRPVVVLSNNDGCVISRSEEAKAAGVRMGTPVFQAREIIERHGIEVFSSNYALYGDMSARVLETLNEFTPEVEVYSIDEAFLKLAGCRGAEDLTALGRRIKEKVYQWTGLPVSVGVAETKTLAKVAARVAKTSAKAGGVVNLYGSPYAERALARVAVEDVWGVGPAYARLLKEKGVATALDLRGVDKRWMRQQAGIVGQRIVLELRGTSCLPLEMCPPPRLTVTVSRSFGRPVETLAELREAVACYTARAAEKLRRRRLAANALLVFLTTNRFAPATTPQYSASALVRLPAPSNYTPELISHALEGVARLYRDGYRFKKAGVTLVELVPEAPAQGAIFDRLDRERARRLMRAVDDINTRMGRYTLHFAAAAGLKRPWQTRSERRSPRFTTCWSELLVLEPS
ncbi:MAG: Y-family DNA polymerase [Pyrinomonadaceae bacterium]